MTVKAQFPDEQAADGSFERQEDAFRDWVSADGSSGYPRRKPAAITSTSRLPVRGRAARSSFASSKGSKMRSG